MNFRLWEQRQTLSEGSRHNMRCYSDKQSCCFGRNLDVFLTHHSVRASWDMLTGDTRKTYVDRNIKCLCWQNMKLREAGPKLACVVQGELIFRIELCEKLYWFLQCGMSVKNINDYECYAHLLVEKNNNLYS